MKFSGRSKERFTMGFIMPLSILIANRGEIAIRIARSLIENGFKPLGVYEPEDKESLHRKYMVEDAEVSSYLNIREIVQVAVELGADGVHPGYGFLSENPEFAREVARKNIVFIGPPPNVMALAGDKIASKIYAERLEIPTLPWVEVKNSEDVLEFAKTHGYPLIVKAAGGGGGRGTRIIRSEKEVESAVKIARIEAEKAFKDPRLYVEPYIEEAKHIEVQILGDGDNVVHLYERECSIQRKFQKIIEEAPSPSITDKEREKLLEYAVTLAKGLKYVNAGTVEFLFDVKNREFYFMEINARLQVEHPVTEMITRKDIVRKQVEIAFYSILDLKQNNITREGHAIEARIYAENPITMEPSPGTIRKYYEPNGPGLRVDSGVTEGVYVSSKYDPMISKVIAWGVDRKMALNRLIRALNEYLIEGIATNIPLVKQLITSPEFIDASYTTSLFEKQMPVISNRILDEAKLHAITISTLIEYDDKGAKNYASKSSLIENVLKSERVSSIKRHAWYYYVNLKGMIERSYVAKRRKEEKKSHR
ncbi:MAG: biotin carboxylase N-terminal domain-containing protein, partial [Desulfurococcaceae archaeon]